LAGYFFIRSCCRKVSLHINNQRTLVKIVFWGLAGFGGCWLVVGCATSRSVLEVLLTLFFYFTSCRRPLFFHLLPADYAGDCFGCLATGLGCRLVVADSASRWALMSRTVCCFAEGPLPLYKAVNSRPECH